MTQEWNISRFEISSWQEDSDKGLHWLDILKCEIEVLRRYLVRVEYQNRGAQWINRQLCMDLENAVLEDTGAF